MFRTEKIKYQKSAMVRSAVLLIFASMMSLYSLAEVGLQNIEYATLPGDELEIRFSFDGPAPEITSYSIEKPARIALDLIGTTSLLKEKRYNLGSGNARVLIVAEDPSSSRTRVIMNLDTIIGFTTRTDGNSLYVVLGEKKPAAQLAVTAGEASTISDIDFRRGAGGEGQVVVQLSNASIPVDMREEGGRIYVEFIGTDIPEKLHRRLDVTDFATPVLAVDTFREGGNTIIVIEPLASGEYESLAYQTDNTYTVNVKPLSAGEVESRKKDAFVFTGEKLSLNFQNIGVRSVLQLIADFTSMNLVASDSVSGNITLRLQNVPWDQALQLILKTKGLDKRTVGNVMLVAPAEEIAQRERLELKSAKQAESLAPLRTEFVQINYAKASAILNLVSKGGGMMTERGTISVDGRTNTLIIQDTAAKLEEMRSIIKKLDIPVRQVLIEARIVLATTDFSHQLGVRWGGMDVQTNDSGSRSTAVGGSLEAVSDFGENFAGGDAGELTSDNLFLDFGVGGTTFALGIADLDSTLLQLELSALESDGFGEVVATPKVLTADQQNAQISAGTQIPYQEASASGATTTAYASAELKLDVTPQITPNGQVFLDLKVTNNSVGQQTGANGAPAIDSNEVKTKVLVGDGETVVLGGIFQVSVAQSAIKTPFLGDLPVVGRFFRADISRETKDELLIFVTPKLIKDTLTGG